MERSQCEALVEALRNFPDLVSRLLEPADPPPSWFIPGTNLMQTGAPITYIGAAVIPQADTAFTFSFRTDVPMWVASVVWVTGLVTGATNPPTAIQRIQVQDTVLYETLSVNNVAPVALLGPGDRVFSNRQTEEQRLWFIDNRAAWKVSGTNPGAPDDAIVQVIIEGYRVHSPGNPSKPNLS